MSSVLVLPHAISLGSLCTLLMKGSGKVQILSQNDFRYRACKYKITMEVIPRENKNKKLYFDYMLPTAFIMQIRVLVEDMFDISILAIVFGI